MRKKQPQVLAGDQIYSSALLFSFHAPLIMLPVSCLCFLFPSLNVETSDSLFAMKNWLIIFALTLYLGLWFFYFFYVRNAVIHLEESEEDETYYDAQMKWRKTARHYHITHFLYGSLYGKDMYLSPHEENPSPAAQLAGLGPATVYGAPAESREAAPAWHSAPQANQQWQSMPQNFAPRLPLQSGAAF